MPKGRVEPRNVECRGCATTFVSDRPGKAAWYCGTCPASPKRSTPYVPKAQRDPEAALRREADRARRVAEQEAERTRRAAERAQERAEVAASRDRQRAEARASRARRREAETAARRAMRELEKARARTERERVAELARVRRELDDLEPKAAKAVADVREKVERVRSLREALQRLDPQPVAPPPMIEAPVVEVPRDFEPVRAALTEIAEGEIATILGHVRRSMTRRTLEDRPIGKQSVQRAVVGLAHSAGIPDTRAALRRLAVEALTWEFRLSGRARDPGDFVADEFAAA